MLLFHLGWVKKHMNSKVHLTSLGMFAFGWMKRLLTSFCLLPIFCLSCCVSKIAPPAKETGSTLDKSSYSLTATLEHDEAEVDCDENTISDISLSIEGQKIDFPPEFLHGVKGMHEDNYTLKQYSDHFILSFAGGDGGETFGVHYTVRNSKVVSGYKGWSVPIWKGDNPMPKYETHTQELPLPNPKDSFSPEL